MVCQSALLERTGIELENILRWEDVSNPVERTALALEANNIHTLIAENCGQASLHLKEIHGKGLLIEVELKPKAKGARRFCGAMQGKRILAKETLTM